MYVNKTDTPANGRQIYINGIRYRSVFSAAIDTDVSAVGLYKLLASSGGAPVTRRNNQQVVVSEDWIFKNPEFLLELMEGTK